MANGGVWVFRNDGVMELEQEPAAGGGNRRKALVYVPANETMRSLEALERRLGTLGWERYYEDRAVVQLHKRDGGVDLISLPRDFAALRSTHMYDVVVKNRNHFKVVDV
ncbi:flowering-promoting factor 1-like protein 5 [Brachypodium distachyon]|uniref:Flowering-promoting factor 1-like protein 5 n=1 Tax=Brachypodium distachyon TaxID=15368 RepID=I1GRA6_BRADI|nr:flowering-promoting factor 1-like protein 5 [Brachypodium distachyon]KQK14714.1 hypothetical protein BRADI_1g18240v3 [Brachypodium distachyon]|eukprot:XP_003562478.1 flowering-promoting factor 1-like protein 5 [Brachypodium distachyon]